MPYDNNLTRGRIPTGELNLIEAMTGAEDFWGRVLQPDPTRGYDPAESELIADGRGPYCAWPPLWRFPWEPLQPLGHP